MTKIKKAIFPIVLITIMAIIIAFHSQIQAISHAESLSVALFSGTKVANISNSNCNSLGNGFFYSNNASESKTIANTPYTDCGFILLSVIMAENGKQFQIALPSSDIRNMKFRHKDSKGVWYDWRGFDTTERDYVVDEADRVAENVRKTMTEKSLVMLGASDFHYRYNDISAVQSMRDMADGMKQIKRQIHTDYDVSYGDIGYVYTGYTDYEDNLTSIIELNKLLSDSFSKNNQIRLVGNHDMNSLEKNKYLSMEYLYSLFGAYNECLIAPDINRLGGYGYIDDEYRKIRLICLNTSDFSDRVDAKPLHSNFNYYMSLNQIKWLVDIMNLSAKPDAADWQLILMSHMPFDQCQMMADGYAEILYAYENGTSFTLKGFTHDFAGENAAALALFIHGHTHAFTVDNHFHKVDDNSYERLKLARICIPNALDGRDAPAEFLDVNFINWGVGEMFIKSPNTVNDTAFVVNSIDPVGKLIYSYCYGAGIDRILHYEPLAISQEYTITPAITPVSWETLDPTIAIVNNGIVTPVADGNIMIYAKAEDGTREYWNLTIAT